MACGHRCRIKDTPAVAPCEHRAKGGEFFRQRRLAIVEQLRAPPRMSLQMTPHLFRPLGALAALALAGCVIETAGPPRHEFQTIERDSSQRLRVRLTMGAGNLQVGSGTEKFLRADFTYDRPEEKPEVRYHSSGGLGDLVIQQPGERHGRIGSHKYEWDIRLARDLPLDLSAQFGAGQAQLDLGSLNLDGVDVEMGVGDLKMDLRGSPKRDYTVRIRGGVGQATIRLPSGCGVVAEAQGGIGSIEAPGLIRHGNRFENEAYASAKVTVHLDIRGGIGSIRLLAE